MLGKKPTHKSTTLRIKNQPNEKSSVWTSMEECRAFPESRFQCQNSPYLIFLCLKLWDTVHTRTTPRGLRTSMMEGYPSGAAILGFKR